MPPRRQRTTKQFFFQHPAAWDPAYADFLLPPTTAFYYPEYHKACLATRTYNSNIRARLARQKQAFPERKSVYIRNQKYQKRVNSARQRIINNPSIITYPPLMRTLTAPHIPVTNLTDVESLDKSQTQEVQETLKKLIPVKNVAPFLQAGSEQSTKERVKQYVVNPTDNAVMYIDKDKFFYFRNNKHDLSHLFKTEGSYIAHLRNMFINRTKCAQREKGTPAKNIVKERIDYDKRVSHILDYYEKGDMSWSEMLEKEMSSQTRAGRNQLSRSAVRSQTPRSPPASRSSRSSSSVRLRSLLSGPRSSNLARGASPDTAEWQSYVKMNVQSVLHNRQYLLQTSDDCKRVQPTDAIACECNMCRLEMGLPSSSQISRSVRVGKKHTDTYEVLNDPAQVQFGDETYEQLDESDDYLSGDESLVSASCESEESGINMKGQVVLDENSDTTTEVDCRRKEKLKKNKKKETNNDTKKNAERHKVEIKKLKSENGIDNVERQNEGRKKEDRNGDYFSNEQTPKAAEYLTVTLPNVVEVSQGDSVRVPDNSPTPGDRPIEDEK